MVRTAATAIRASGGKSSKAVRKSTFSTNTHGSSSSDKHSVGGNPVHPRETPSWQKPITNFFTTKIEEIDPVAILEKPVRNEEVTEVISEGSNTPSTKDRIIIEKEGLEVQESNSNKENVTVNQIEKNMESYESVACQSGVTNTNKKRSIESNDEVNKAPKKKPNSNFYKHLEEIEKYVNC